jgi:uncharacterized membrane protein
LGSYAVAWIAVGVSFAALVQALTPLHWSQVPGLVAVFSAAYVIGFLTLLTPGGLGVREGVLTLLLATILPSGVSAVVAILARLWMVVVEVAGAGIALLAGARQGVSGIRFRPSAAEASPSAPLLSSSHARPLASRRRPSLPCLLLLVLIVAYTIGFSAMSLRLHQAQLTHKSDLGQMDLALWNTSRGRFVQEIKGDSVSTRLTDHVEPIFLPVSLIFWLWDDVRALLILQSLLLALGALPVFWLARSRVRRSGSQAHGGESPLSAPPNAKLRTPNYPGWIGLAFAFVYLMFPALQASNLTEFHAITLAVPLILLALWFADRERWLRFAVSCILLMAVKEEAALLAFMLGLYVVSKSVAERLSRRRAAAGPAKISTSPWVQVDDSRITHHESRPTHHESRLPHHLSRSTRLVPLLTGLLIAGLGLAWFAVATFIIIPGHAATVYGDATSVYFQRYGELGHSVGTILRSLLTRPGLVYRTVTQPLRLRYLLTLLAPVGFLALLAPEILLLSAPLLVANLFSSYAAQYSGAFHYSAPLVPYFLAAAIVGAGRLLRWLNPRDRQLGDRSRARFFRWTALAAWLLAWSLGWQVAQGYTPFGNQFRWPEITHHHRLLARFTSQVPREAPGSATPALFPHLSHREKLYLFPHLGDSQWALLDVTGSTDMHPAAMRDQVQHMLNFGEWGVLDGADGYLLLARGQGEARIPDEFYSFALDATPQPQQAVDLTFSSPATSAEVGALRLLGYDLVDDDQWRLTSLRTYWQPLGLLPADLRVYPFFVAEDGTIVEDTIERQPVAMQWYPTARWAIGETVIVETLPWFLPRRWGLAVGVMQGQSWGLREHRWQISGSSAAATFDNSTWSMLGLYERQGDMLEPLADTMIAQPAVLLPADFAGQLELLGHDGLPESVPAGTALHLQMLWQAPQPPDLDYSIFLHLRDEADRTMAQWDGQPTWYGEQPTTTWTPGTIVRSAHTLSLATDALPGRYRLVVGVYDWRTADRLPVLDHRQQPVSNELEMGMIQVRPAGPTAAPVDLCCALFSECCVSAQQQ